MASRSEEKEIQARYAASRDSGDVGKRTHDSLVFGVDDERAPANHIPAIAGLASASADLAVVNDSIHFLLKACELFCEKGGMRRKGDMSAAL